MTWLLKTLRLIKVKVKVKVRLKVKEQEQATEYTDAAGNVFKVRQGGGVRGGGAVHAVGSQLCTPRGSC